MLHRFLLLLTFLPLLTFPAWAAPKVTYETDVRPILREHCFACHNQDDPTASLALDSFEGLTAGGAGGEVIVAGDPDASRLWKLVTHQEAPKMPPGDKLPQAQLDIMKAWIAGGLLKDSQSKPLKNSRPVIAKLDASKLGKPIGEAAMPTELFHEPVLWTRTPGPVEALATSPWAPLAAVAWQRQVSFYHTDSYELLGILPYLDGIPQVVRFSRDGSLLLVAGGQHAKVGSVSLFDVKTGARLAKLGDELDIVLAADISPDHSLVALGGPKKKVRVYRVADGELVYEIGKHTDWITAVGFSPDGKLLATADRNGGALVWQASAGHERADLRGHQRAITSLDWRADAAMLATASEDGTVRLWNREGRQSKSITAHKPGVLSVRFANNGNFVTAGRDWRLKTWKPDGSAITDLGKLRGLALAATFTHDGKQILASDYAGEVRLVNAADKKLKTTLQANPPPLAQRLAAANKQLKKVRRKQQAGQQHLAALQSALENGQADWDAHGEKKEQAQITLDRKRADYEMLAKQHSNQEEQATAIQIESDRTAQLLSAARQELEQTQQNNEADPDQISALQQAVDQAQQAQAISQEKAQHVATALQQFTEQQQVAEKAVQVAEATLTQVTNEIAGLPDLEKLTSNVNQARSELASSQRQLETARALKKIILSQQQRFRRASAELTSKIQQQRQTQQEIAKQSGRLEAEHQQAARQLATHEAQLTAVSKQLTELQARLTALQAAGTKLKQQEHRLAAELAKVRSSLTKSQQKVQLLETTQQDFQATEDLRKAYAY